MEVTTGQGHTVKCGLEHREKPLLIVHHDGLDFHVGQLSQLVSDGQLDAGRRHRELLAKRGEAHNETNLRRERSDS